MNLHAIPNFLAAILSLTAGLLATLKNRISKINFSFFLLATSAFIWQLGTGLALLAKDPFLALIATRIAFLGIIFIPVFSYRLSLHIFGVNSNKTLIFGYMVASFIFIPLSWTPLMLNGVYTFPWGFFFKAGKLHPIFIAFFIYYMIAVFSNLFLSYKKEKEPLEKIRKKYFLVALFIAYIGSIDYLPAYGLHVYPFGCLTLICFVLIVTYAIIRHQLFDINIVIRKGLVYSILAASVTAVFFTILLVTEKFFQGLVGYQSLIVTAIIGFIITLGFNPLKNRLQRFIDRRFFKGTMEEISFQNERLMQQIQQADKLKAIATLAAGMAHEIKNPLTAVKTFSQYLPQKYNDNDFINKYGQIVPQEIERINKIVADVLLFSKPKEPDFKEVDINNLLSDTLDFLSNDFLNKNIKVVKEFSLNHSVILADPDQMKQVFLNLFLNALDAMDYGGALTIEVRDGSDAEPSLSAIEVIVHDTGCGISEENLKHIFEPFHTTKSNGTGLGLAVVRNIINHHKADIKVKSEVGKGTMFILRFPAVPN